MDNIYIGIDPGVTGAIAVLNDNQIMQVVDFPRDNPRRLISIYKGFNTPNVKVCVEDIIILSKQLNVISAKKLYETFFQHKFCLDYYGIDYKIVNVKTWQKEFGLTKTKKITNKIEPWGLALNLFGYTNKHLRVKSKDHNKADALLIAEYCRRISL